MQSSATRRMVYFSTLVGTILLGLLWRSGRLHLPAFLGKYGGDALWALALFFAISLCLATGGVKVRGALTLVLAFAVELGQLWHPLWLDGIRSTRLGHLFLGSTFNAPDLGAYAIGVCVGMLIDRLAYTPECFEETRA